MGILRIDYVELPTSNMEKTKKFYNQVFGWEFQDWGADYASFSDGRLSGGFNAELKIGYGGPLIILYSSTIEETRAKIVQSGGHIVKEIFDFPGGRRFHFTDPSKNELAVWSDK